jgi:5'-3' exonuclease
MCYRSFFACRRDIEDVGWGYFKHVMYNSIFSFCHRFEPDQVIVAADSKQNWRRQVYPEYKRNRKERRDAQDDVDWEGLYNAMDELLKEMKVYFPFMVLRIQYMEADDIIGAYVRSHPDEKCTAITSDGDYLQLLRYKNVQVFDPMKNKFMKTDDPLKALKVKILHGDTGDNIPNIIKRQMKDPAVKKRLGEKTAEKYVEDNSKLKALFEDKTILTEQVLNEDGEPELDDEGNEKINTVLITENVDGEEKEVPLTLGKQAKIGYKRNSILIDLQHIPDKLIQIMDRTIDEYIFADGKDIFQYFAKNKFREFVHKMDYVEKAIKPLVEYNQQREVFG